MKRLILQFGLGPINGLLADRDFIGDEWLGWLQKEQIPLVIRIRNNLYTETSCGKRTRVDRFPYLIKRLLKPGEVLTIPRRQLGRHRVFLSGLRLGEGELWIVASGHFEPEAIRIYGLRWEIETLLGVSERPWL